MVRAPVLLLLTHQAKAAAQQPKGRADNWIYSARVSSLRSLLAVLSNSLTPFPSFCLPYILYYPRHHHRTFDTTRAFHLLAPAKSPRSINSDRLVILFLSLSLSPRVFPLRDGHQIDKREQHVDRRAAGESQDDGQLPDAILCIESKSFTGRRTDIMSASVSAMYIIIAARLTSLPSLLLLLFVYTYHYHPGSLLFFW